MGNKRTKIKKPKQDKGKATSRAATAQQGGASLSNNLGSLSPVKKKKKK